MSLIPTTKSPPRTPRSCLDSTISLPPSLTNLTTLSSLTLLEMLSLPAAQRNALAIHLCKRVPSPLQLMVLCTSEAAYAIVSAEVMRLEQEREARGWARMPDRLDEILALPVAEREWLARRRGVVCWDPYTVHVSCRPAPKLPKISDERMERYARECGVLLDE